MHKFTFTVSFSLFSKYIKKTPKIPNKLLFLTTAIVFFRNFRYRKNKIYNFLFYITKDSLNYPKWVRFKHGTDIPSFTL